MGSIQIIRREISVRRAAKWTALAIALTIAVAPLLPESVEYTHTLTSDRVNGVHQDLDVDISPIELGPVVIRLSTPTYRLEVFEHELQLGAMGEGVDAGRVRARFSGEAHLVAELGLGDVTSEIDDNIELPLQEIDLGGRVELVREGDGYQVTTIETPSHVEIQMESDLAGSLELLCKGFAVMAMGNIDCDSLDQLLSRIKVPLPETGRQFFVASSDLTAHERQQIEDYLTQRGD